MEHPSDHGGAPTRGLDHVARSRLDRGRFGRMFRTLAPFSPTDADLKALADSMGDEGPAGGAAGDNPDLPSGYTYLAQFVDHDITFDPVSMLGRSDDPDALTSYRTARFDLDSLYGRGPLDSPYLYDAEDPAKLLIGRNTDRNFEPEDLPRNQQGRALIGDPRNDVHAIVSQLHLAFLRFHNGVVDHLRTRFFPADRLFDEARRLVRWHYQWVVVHDFLRRMVASDTLDAVLGGERRFYWWHREPFLPVEFSGAAYRFGHSMVRPAYRLNGQLDLLPILTPARDPNPGQHLGGFRPLPRTWTVDWSFFFSAGGSSPGTSTPQPSRRIDTRLCKPLRELPEEVDRDRRSLGLLNLLRGRALGLPSGQAVAAAMGTAVPDSELGLSGETPLWFYLLRESQVLSDGLNLGPTAGRIVAEVVVGLLSADPVSFLRMAPAWEPELPGRQEGRFTIVDLLRIAGVLA